MNRVCGEENWAGCENHSPAETEPRAVRWARRYLKRAFNPDWSKWHYTEGNGLHTACGRPVVLFEIDGSPQEHGVGKVNCKLCLRQLKPVV